MPACGSGSREIVEGKKFCTFCGTPVGTSVASASSAGPACPTCRALNRLGARFCRSCGTDLRTTPAPAAPTAETATLGEVAAAAGPQRVSPAEPAPRFQLCRACGTANRTGTRHCKSCGEALAGSPPSQPTTATFRQAAQTASSAASSTPRSTTGYHPVLVEEAGSRKPVLIAAITLLLVAAGGAGWYFWANRAAPDPIVRVKEVLSPNTEISAAFGEESYQLSSDGRFFAGAVRPAASPPAYVLAVIDLQERKVAWRLDWPSADELPPEGWLRPSLSPQLDYAVFASVGAAVKIKSGELLFFLPFVGCSRSAGAEFEVNWKGPSVVELSCTMEQKTGWFLLDLDNRKASLHFPSESRAGAEQTQEMPIEKVSSDRFLQIYQNSWRAVNESTALGNLRKLGESAMTYAARYPSQGFPSTLADMGPPPSGAQAGERAAGLIDAALASGAKTRYTFAYSISREAEGGPVTGFLVVASPADERSGSRIFCVNHSGVMRHVRSGQCNPFWSAALNSTPITAPSISGQGGAGEPASDTANTVRNLLAQAESRFQQSDYRGALTACDEALRLDPQNSQAQALKGKVVETMRILGVEPGSSPTADSASGSPARAQIAANERSAVGSVRTVNTAEVTYSSTYPNVGFTCNLRVLGYGAGNEANEAGAKLIDESLAIGQKNGYRFRLQHCQGNPKVTYQFMAEPITPGVTGERAFCSDQSGVIRFTVDGSGASCLARGQPLM